MLDLPPKRQLIGVGDVYDLRSYRRADNAARLAIIRESVAGREKREPGTRNSLNMAPCRW